MFLLKTFTTKGKNDRKNASLHACKIGLSIGVFQTDLCSDKQAFLKNPTVSTRLLLIAIGGTIVSELVTMGNFQRGTPTRPVLSLVRFKFRLAYSWFTFPLHYPVFFTDLIFPWVAIFCFGDIDHIHNYY